MESLLTIGLDQTRFIIHDTEFFLLLPSLYRIEKNFTYFFVNFLSSMLYSSGLYTIDRKKKIKNIEKLVFANQIAVNLARDVAQLCEI